jgi:hypothetical protein
VHPLGLQRGDCSDSLGLCREKLANTIRINSPRPGPHVVGPWVRPPAFNLSDGCK